MPSLFNHFKYSLKPGGYLICETFAGHGGNYLALPRTGEWKQNVEDWLDLDLYDERRVGPPHRDSAVVKMVGRKILGV
jgi:hypothetical protein